MQRFLNTRIAATGLALGLAAVAGANITLSPAVNYLVGPQPSGAAAGDFDGDKDLDLAVTVDAPDRVVLLINNGAGVMSPGATVFLPSGSGVGELVAGDLDGDGDADLAVALKNLNQLRILTNNGGAATTGNITVTDTLPAELTFVAAGSGGGAILAGFQARRGEQFPGPGGGFMTAEPPTLPHLLHQPGEQENGFVGFNAEQRPVIHSLDGARRVPALTGQLDPQRQVLSHRQPLDGQWEIADVPRHPQGLEVRYRAPAGDVRPAELLACLAVLRAARGRRLVAEQAQDVGRHLEFPLHGDRRRLRRHVVGVVEHAGEIAQHRGNGLVAQHEIGRAHV